MADVKRLTDRLNDKKGQIISRQKELNFEEVTQKLATSFKSYNEQMKEEVDAMHTLIDIKYRYATKDFEWLRDFEIQRLTTQKETLDSLIAEMNSACDFATSVCESAHPIQILTSQNQVMNRLKELQNTRIPKVDSSKMEFAFTEAHKLAMSKLSDSLKSLDTKWVE